MVAAAGARSLSILHARLVKTRDPNSLRDLLLLLPVDVAASTLSYARAIFAGNAPTAHAFPWNALIRAHAFAPCDAPCALELFACMRRGGVPLDCYSFPPLLRACSLHPSPLNGLHSGKAAHALIVKQGLLAVHASNALIAFYGRRGLADDALQVFCEMPQMERDVVSWSALIECIAYGGTGSYQVEALEAFRLMQVSGVLPDEAAMVTIAWAAGGMGAPDLAAWAYCYVRSRGIRITVSLGTALVVALARCGWIAAARKLFDEMPERNVITRTAMIGCLASHGRAREALEMFHRMVRDGLKPDHVAFVGALTACSHGGLVEEGMELFESMEREHGVTPRMEHYGCVVDMMGRAGMVARAQEFVERMPLEPGPVVWRTLLGACVSHGYVELAEQVKGKLAEAEAERDGDYVLLSNAYGGVGRWEEKAAVWSEMRCHGVAKTPGLSAPAL